MFDTGAVLGGRYMIERVVGAGGMAMVYRAQDQKTGDTVAIKVLRSEYASDGEFVRRFSREAEAAAKMSHENIVNLLDMGIEGDQRYIVMEYVDGITLKEMIRRERTIRVDVVLRLSMRLLAAVDHAHRNGIVHRDIKPQNILVDRHGRVKVADFGIARLKADQTTRVDDGTAAAMGSVHYFSPEQARGEVADEKSDLYSVGVVMYEMLTGKVPFDGETSVSVALKHINEPPESICAQNSQIPQALDEVVARALAKDPARRYQSAAEMAADLRQSILRPLGGFVQYPLTREEQERKRENEFRRRARRRKRILRSLAFASAVIFIACSASLVWYFNERYDTGVMPSLYGLTLSEVQSSMEEAGLPEYEIEYVYSDVVSSGLVVNQSRRETEHVKRKSTVLVSISMGSEWYQLEDVTGRNMDDVRTLLREIGVKNVRVETIFSDAAVGTVISQLPASGKTSRSVSIVLYVSGEHATVPTVTGILLSDADDVLAEEGLSVGQITYAYSPDYESGVVLAQTIAPNTQVLKGSSVDLTICESVEKHYPVRDIEVTIRTDDTRVTAVLVTPNRDTVEALNEVFAAGVYSLDLSSYESGRHIVRIYIDGVLEETMLVDFD